MKFSDIPGHESIKRRMRQMVYSGRLPHALIIEGPEGTGKLAMARALAQYIHCENRDPDGDACGECRSCRLHQSMNHVDTHYTFPVVKLDGMNSAPTSDDFYGEWTEFISNRIYTSINEWSDVFGKKNAHPLIYVTESEALVRKLSFTSHVSKQKIVILWLPERLHESAANKLLKIIEEPPEDTILILVSNSPGEILPTIYSRVQRLQMKRLPDAIIASNLRKLTELTDADAMAAAHNAEGNMIKAMEQTGTDEESKINFDTFVSLMRLAYKRDVRALRDWSDDLAARGREKEMAFYDYASRMVRENFIINLNVPELTYLTDTERAFAKNFARFITTGNVEKLSEVFAEASRDIAGNGNGKIINYDIAIKTILLLKK